MFFTFFVSAYARDRTVSDSLGRALITDVFPEISVVEVPSTVKKYYQFFAKPLLERTEQPDSLL